MLLKCHGNTHALFISMTKYKHYFCYPKLNHSWELEFSFNKDHQSYQFINLTRQTFQLTKELFDPIAAARPRQAVPWGTHTVPRSSHRPLTDPRVAGDKLPVFSSSDKCALGPVCSRRTFRKEGTSCQKNVLVGDTYPDLRDCSTRRSANKRLMAK